MTTLQYGFILTQSGLAKDAAARANQGTIHITAVSVGDGNGAFVTPISTQTGLVHEFWRGAPDSVLRDPANPTQIDITFSVPSTAGPATVREIGIWTDDGQLYAVGNHPDIGITAPVQNAIVMLQVQVALVSSNASAITISINPSSQVFISQIARLPFIGVDGFVNVAPANPAVGALVVIGTAPTGIFTGLANQLAQWNGQGWVTAAASLMTIVGNAADSKYYQLKNDGWHVIDLGQGGDYYAVDTSTAANTITAAFPVAPPSYAAITGKLIRIKIANTITGATVANLNGLGNVDVVRPNSSALGNNEAYAGEIAVLAYDGTALQLIETEAALLNPDWNAVSGVQAILNKPSLGGRLLNVRKLSVSGTYVPTPGTKLAHVTATGGGGPGIGGSWNNPSGGAAGTAIGLIDMTGVASLPYTIGAPGVAGVGSAPGTQGGTTTFGPLTATGGGPPSVDSPDAIGGAPGTASGGYLNLKGQAGSGVVNLVGATGGASYWGGGGLGGHHDGANPSPNGQPGGAPGAGGGGGDGGTSGTSNGGDGEAGVVEVYEYS